ncbi:hypothetical protein C8R47DRAFT_1083564 [Mycena vitilis]|nr:hypothetical protein C8R47DRAFT_1083564 [Mycena vitilis]
MPALWADLDLVMLQKFMRQVQDASEGYQLTYRVRVDPVPKKARKNELYRALSVIVVLAELQTLELIKDELILERVNDNSASYNKFIGSKQTNSCTLTMQHFSDDSSHSFLHSCTFHIHQIQRDHVLGATTAPLVGIRMYIISKGSKDKNFQHWVFVGAVLYTDHMLTIWTVVKREENRYMEDEKDINTATIAQELLELAGTVT